MDKLNFNEPNVTKNNEFDAYHTENYCRILNHQHSGGLRPMKYPKTAKNCCKYMKNYIFGLKMATLNFSEHKVIKSLTI